MAIGGLREKTMAAYKMGIRTICIPADNIPDLDDVAPVVKENVTFYPCSHVDEVLAVALTDERPEVNEETVIPQPLSLIPPENVTLPGAAYLMKNENE
jgi:ATP-dependent Lon protease